MLESQMSRKNRNRIIDKSKFQTMIIQNKKRFKKSMLKNVKLVIAISVALVLFASSINIAHADGASLWTTYDADSTHHQNTFAPGQTVYVFWSPIGSSQHIRIYDVDNNIVYDFGVVSGQPAEWKIPDDAAAGTMYWIVIPGVGPFPISVATITILPESNLGAFTGIAVGLGFFGSFTFLRKNRKKLGSYEVR
jgi:hypothetical protein